MTEPTYSFHRWEFIGAEIDQIIYIFAKHANGYLEAHERHGLTENVEHYAINWGILTWDEQLKRLRYSSRPIDPKHDMPVEAQIRLEDMQNEEAA